MKYLAFTLTLLLIPLGTYAASVTIEPDDYPANSVLTSVSPYATLNVADSLNTSSTFFKVTSTGVSEGAPTGALVFGHDNLDFWPYTTRLRVDFSYPTSSVSIAFASRSIVSERGTLEVYDAKGALLGSYVTNPLSDGESEIMTVNMTLPRIAYAVAYTPQAYGTFGMLDSLTFLIHHAPEISILKPKSSSIRRGKTTISGTVSSETSIASIKVKAGGKQLRVTGLKRWRAKMRIKEKGRYKIVATVTDSLNLKSSTRKAVTVK